MQTQPELQAHNGRTICATLLIPSIDQNVFAGFLPWRAGEPQSGRKFSRGHMTRSDDSLSRLPD